MKEIGIKKLTNEALAPYGSSDNMLKLEGSEEKQLRVVKKM